MSAGTITFQPVAMGEGKPLASADGLDRSGRNLSAVDLPHARRRHAPASMRW